MAENAPNDTRIECNSKEQEEQTRTNTAQSSSAKSDGQQKRDGAPREDNTPSSLPKKAVLTVRLQNSDITRRISFFPESNHTTPESLRGLLIDAFGLDASAQIVLVDSNDGTLVPLDKSICYLQEVTLVAESPRRQASKEEDVSEIKTEALRMAKLLDVCSSISGESPPSRAVRTVVEQTKEVLDADHVNLYILDNGSKALVLVAQTTIGLHIMRPNTADYDSEFATSGNTADASAIDDDVDDFALDMCERIPLMDDVVPNGRCNPSRLLATDAALTGDVIVSGRHVCVPVKQGNGPIIGVLEAIRSKETFSEQDIHTLEFIATCSSNVLLRLQLCYQAYRAEERAEALVRVTKTLSRARKPDDIVKLIVKDAYELLRAERIAVFLVHPQDKELEICVSKDANGRRIPVSHGFASYVAQTGETLNIADARQDSRFNSVTDTETGFRTKSMLCCPVLDSAGRVIGVIQALNKLVARSETPDTDSASGSQCSSPVVPFTADDQRLLELLTQSAGVTLQNVQLLQAAERAKDTTRTLLRLVQLIVGENSFTNLDQLLRNSCKQLLDCDRCIIAWISRTDNTLRILLDDHQTLSISRDDPVAVEAKMCSSKGLANFSFAENGNGSGLVSRFEERTGYKVESILCAPIAGGIQGPVAYMLAFNKLEPESSLARASSGQMSRAPRQRVPRASYKAFQKEDESDMLLFCTEVEGALRVKRNVSMDVNNFLLEEAVAEECADLGNLTPGAAQTIDSQQKRLMLLYSGIDGPPVAASPSIKSSEKKRGGVKRTAEDRAAEENGDMDSILGSLQNELAVEQEAKATVERELSDSLNLDVLNQPLEVCKSWSLALFLSEMPLLKQCQIDIRKMPRFVSEVHDNYNDNPFHNFFHAFSVLHTAHDLVRRTVEGRKLDALCTISVLLAAICHDLGHKGVTNSFETNSLSELALCYSDDAVLERYHCHVAFRILLQDPRSNILATTSREDLNVMRKYIIEGILATDMRKHAEHVAELEAIVLERRRALLNRSTSFLLDADYSSRTPTLRSRRGSLESVGSASSLISPAMGSPKQSQHRRSSSFFSAVPETEYSRRQSPPSPVPSQNQDAFDLFLSKPEGKSFLVRTVVHAADLSGQTLRFDIAEDWGRRIEMEFNAQAEKERSMGLPVSVPVCNSEADFYKSQAFFIRQIVLPLWRGVAELLPETSPRADALVRNVEHYEAQVRRLAREATEASAREAQTSSSSPDDEKEREAASEGSAHSFPRTASLVEVSIAMGNPNIDI